jgi:hypothetical protein
MPDLNFHIESAGVLEFAATPSLLFKLRIENRGAETVRSITLNTQLRIKANWRPYSAGEQEKLWEVFGEKQGWAQTLQSLLWTHATTVVPVFTGSTVVDLPIPCTYDFEVVSAKYFHHLENGEVSLEFLFSGTMFYEGEAGLQAAQISWEKEAEFRLPVALWRQAMEHYFPNSAWLRLRRDTFDRLCEYKARHGLPTWEAAIEKLLGDDDGKATMEKLLPAGEESA